MTKRTTKNRLLQRIPTSSGPLGAKETTLRDHLQNLLDGLPQDLPTYYHEALLDDICFLLGSPLFLYAISPRIRRDEQTLASSLNKAAATRVPVDNGLNIKVPYEKKAKLDMSNLRMKINRYEQGWVTRLLYKDATLIEGREYSPLNDNGFAPSFRFFCEEVEFLGYEFRAREHAAAVAYGTSVDKEIRKRGCESVSVVDEKRKRRLVKLKIRFKLARGKARKMAR